MKAVIWSLRRFADAGVKRTAAGGMSHSEFLAVLAQSSCESPLHADDWLRSHISTLSDLQLKHLYKAYSSACGRGYKLTEGEAETLVTAAARLLPATLRGMDTLFHATRLAPFLSAAGHSLLPLMQQFALCVVDRKFVRSQNLFTLSQTLQAFVNVCPVGTVKHTLFTTKSGLELADMMESELSKALFHTRKPEAESWGYILATLIRLDRCSEDFIRAMERFVFSNLDVLSNENLSDVILCYTQRKTFDIYYIQTNVLQPYCREFARRCGHLPAQQMALICHRLWAKAKHYGIYCDSGVVSGLQEAIMSDFWVQKNSESGLGECLQSIVTYLVSAGYFELASLYARVVQLQATLSVSNMTSVRTALAFAQAQYGNAQFWAAFSERFTDILADDSLHETLYLVLLHLRTFSLPLYSALVTKAGERMDSLRDSWRKTREAERDRNVRSWLHGKTADFLQAAGVDFEEEFFDEVHIDIALVKQKIAVEICGTSHFVLPSMILNGRTLARKALLESLGWKVVVVPFHFQRTEGLEKILDGLLSKHIAYDRSKKE